MDVLRCVCVRLPCAQPLYFSAHYSPRGGSSERHRSEAHTATHAFPCQQSQLTRDPDSRMFLFHNFIQQVFTFAQTILSPIFKCLDKLHNDKMEGVHSVNAVQIHRSWYPGALTAQPSLQHADYILQCWKMLFPQILHGSKLQLKEFLQQRYCSF